MINYRVYYVYDEKWKLVYIEIFYDDFNSFSGFCFVFEFIVFMFIMDGCF